MQPLQTIHQQTHQHGEGGNLRRTTNVHGHGRGGAMIDIGHPHMEGHGTQLEGNTDDDKAEGEDLHQGILVIEDTRMDLGEVQ